MPYFTVEDLKIDPSEYIWSCGPREKNELVDLLADEGYVYENHEDESFDALEPSTYSDVEMIRLMKDMWESRQFWSPTEVDAFRKQLQEKKLI